MEWLRRSHLFANILLHSSAKRPSEPEQRPRCERSEGLNNHDGAWDTFPLVLDASTSIELQHRASANIHSAILHHPYHLRHHTVHRRLSRLTFPREYKSHRRRQAVCHTILHPCRHLFRCSSHLCASSVTVRSRSSNRIQSSIHSTTSQRRPTGS